MLNRYIINNIGKGRIRPALILVRLQIKTILNKKKLNVFSPVPVAAVVVQTVYLYTVCPRSLVHLYLYDKKIVQDFLDTQYP